MSNVNEPPVAIQQQPKGGGSATKIVLAILAVLLVVSLACGGILVALLLPAVQTAREAARRMQCANNMKQISLALLNYESTYETFPPAFTVDDRGNKLHSWRTLILPYMEQAALYEQIDLSKPWDDPANAFLADTSLAGYACPSANLPPGKTTYVAIIDPSGIFAGPEPVKLRDVSDGVSNTLLVAEVDNASAVHWASPEDTDPASYLSALGATAHTGGATVAMASGSVEFISSAIDPERLENMVTKDGGETTPGL
ncbi:MAG: DUF1559 domain-containing protein [Aureliella sp.]